MAGKGISSIDFCATEVTTGFSFQALYKFMSFYTNFFAVYYDLIRIELGQDLDKIWIK